MQSLVVSVSDLAWDSDDHKNAMLGHMLIYFAIYGTLGMEVCDFAFASRSFIFIGSSSPYPTYSLPIPYPSRFPFPFSLFSLSLLIPHSVHACIIILMRIHPTNIFYRSGTAKA